jgi:hypothetical protein
VELEGLVAGEGGGRDIRAVPCEYVFGSDVPDSRRDGSGVRCGYLGRIFGDGRLPYCQPWWVARVAGTRLGKVSCLAESLESELYARQRSYQFRVGISPNCSVRSLSGLS